MSIEHAVKPLTFLTHELRLVADIVGNDFVLVPAAEPSAIEGTDEIAEWHDTFAEAEPGETYDSRTRRSTGC